MSTVLDLLKILSIKEKEMETKINEIEVNGIKYIPKDQSTTGSGNYFTAEEDLDGDEYVIVRAKEAGCFSGYLESYDSSDCEAVLKNARRLWYWTGAASLSQLAVDGTSKPKDCKFPTPVGLLKIFGVIEIIDCTEKSRKSIQEVPVWEVK